MVDWIKNLLGSSSEASMMRLLTLFTVFDILLSWNVVCLGKMVFVDIPWGVVAIFTAVVTGKAVQKFAEPKW